MTQNCPPKPWLSIEQQILLMRSRGLIVNNSPETVNALRHFGYYRLSGYSYVLRETDAGTGEKLNSFKPGSSFDYVVKLYSFDKNLRLLMLDALEKIEISLRASVAYSIGGKDPLFYKNPSFFRKEYWGTKYPDWIKKQEKKLTDSREDCIKHNVEKYGENIPIWVLCQVWDFGQLSWLLQLLTPDNVKLVCQSYGFAGHQHFLSWLVCFNELRNICAHHSRLWNRKFSFAPKKPSNKDLKLEEWCIPLYEQRDNRTLFFRAYGIIQFLKFIEVRTVWADRFTSYMKKFPSQPELGVSLANLGFPKNWDDLITHIKNDLPRTSQVTNHSD